MGIGRKIREIRIAIGLTQRQVEENAGMPRGSLCRIEKEHVDPTFSTVDSIIKKGFGMEIDFLTSESDMRRFAGMHDLLAAKPKDKLLERLEEYFDKLDKESKKMMLSLAEQLSRPRGDNQQAA